MTHHFLEMIVNGMAWHGMQGCVHTDMSCMLMLLLSYHIPSTPQPVRCSNFKYLRLSSLSSCVPFSFFFPRVGCLVWPLVFSSPVRTGTVDLSLFAFVLDPVVCLQLSRSHVIFLVDLTSFHPLRTPVLL